jgi:hypothetical protein
MKKYALLVLLIFTVTLAFSQTFTHGVGVAVFVTTAKGGNAAAAEGVTYSPRINFLEQPDFSLSVGIPLSVGISGSYSSNYNSQSGSTTDNTLGFMANIPLIINFNFGAGSSPDNESRFGFYIGGGAGYHYGKYNVDTVDSYGGDYTYQATIKGFGPAANAGVRFGVGRGTHNVEARLTYMKSLDDSKANIFGIGGLFNF